MANVKKGLVEARKQEVLNAFRSHGSMTYSEVGKVLEITYNQARDYVGQLVMEHQLKAVKTIGRTIYFNVTDGSALPSLLGGSGFVNLSVVVRRSLDHKLLLSEPDKLFRELLAICYSQPMLAKVSNSVSDDDLSRAKTIIAELKQFAEDCDRIATELEAKLIPADPPVGYYDWADDPQYDKELAIQARQRNSELPEYVVNAYRMLVGESAGINPLEPDTDSTDES